MQAKEFIKRLLYFIKKSSRLYFIPLFILFGSCDQNIPIGLDFVRNDPLHIISIDTITAKFSTVYLDSISTSNSERLLVGHHEDSIWGIVESKSYFHLSLDSISTLNSDNVNYTGAYLRLYFDQYWYYDTTQFLTLSLYQLEEELKSNKETSSLYNTSSFEYDSVSGLLGRWDFVPWPHDEYIELPIEFGFGEGLFNSILENDENVINSNFFKEDYKGFVLQASSGEGPFLGFSASSAIILKYSEGEEQGEVKFTVGSNLHFNQISGNLSTGILSSLNSRREDLASELTKNRAFIRGGFGLGVRVEFPHLHNLKELAKNIYINEAYLLISPVYESSYNHNLYPSTFSVHWVDKLNREYGELTISPVLYYNQEFKEESFYRFSVASFLNEQLRYGEHQGDALLLTIPVNALNKSVTKVSIGNRNHLYKSQLRALIITLDENGF